MTDTMTQDWYYRAGGHQGGPVPLSRIAELIRHGRFHPADEFRHGSSGDWEKVSDVQDRFNLHKPRSVDGSGSNKMRRPPSRLVSHDIQVSLPTAASRWFCRVNNQVDGPFDARSLLRMVDDRLLLPQDLVRPGIDGAWQEYFLYEEQIEHEAATDEGDSGETAEHGRNAPPENIHTGQVNPVRHAYAFHADGQATDTASSLEPTTTRAAPKKRFGTPSRSQDFRQRVIGNWDILTALAFLVLVGVVLLALPALDENHTSYRLYSDLWSRAQELRDRSANASEWAMLSHEAHELVDPILFELEGEADVGHPAEQHLLWAGRDYLLPMIDAQLSNAQNPQSPNESLETRFTDQERRLHTHMRVLERVLAGRRG